jgi:hypothetical protein
MKKTNKENPVTFFRKANEARQKTVKASLKKAQDGISFKGSQLAKEYEKAPMVGAEPEWSALEMERDNAKRGPSNSPGAYVSPYYESNVISNVNNKKTVGSNVMNDPRFSRAQEIGNDFYNKEKREGTLYEKGYGKRKSNYKPSQPDPKTGKYSFNTFNSSLKKGGTIKSKKKK